MISYDMDKVLGHKELKEVFFWRALLAEFIGTFFLVTVGCGSATATTSRVEIAFAFGLIVGIMAQVFGHVSGGHINPAVTIGMLVTGNVSIIKATCYIVCQLLGSVLGAAILSVLLPGKFRDQIGQTGLHEDLSAGQGFGIEILITFVLVITVFSVMDPNRPLQKGVAPVVIGLSVSVCHLWAIKYTGASMNTARTFGPALVSNAWNDHWVYWVGPLLGGAIAGILYKYVFAAPLSAEGDEKFYLE